MHEPGSTATMGAAPVPLAEQDGVTIAFFPCGEWPEMMEALDGHGASSTGRRAVAGS